MNLANVVTEAISALEQSGAIRTKIDHHLDKAVEDIVSDLFRYNAPIKKAIEEKIKESLQFDPKLIQLPNYQALIAEQANVAFCKAMEAAGLLKTEEIVRGFIGETESGPLKLSVLVDLLKESEWIDEDDEGHEVSVFAETTKYGSLLVYMDFNERVSKHRCRIEVHAVAKDGKIISVRIDNSDLSISKKALILGRPNKIETVLTHAFVSNRPLVFDCSVEDLDLEVCGEYVKARRGD